MLLSRFFYLLLGLAVAYAIFLLYLASAVSNRSGLANAERLLTSSESAVGWYLTDDARRRAASLVLLAVNPTISKTLKEADEAATLKDVKPATRAEVKKVLTAFRESMKGTPTEVDALWAIDRHGRVIASENFERGTDSEHFEMGGYALVADAIHGWIRDDAWVLDSQIYRVVAHPVEVEVNGTPVGCVVAAKIVDARFAQAISDRTNAAVAFFAGGTRVATGAPAEFDKALLEIHAADLEKAQGDPNFADDGTAKCGETCKGKTRPMILRENVGNDVMVMFSRLPGEAWQLGAGYVVGHRQTKVRTPLDYQTIADQNDKDAVPYWLLASVVAAGALLGLLLSLLEHTLPLRRFRRAVTDLANKRSETDVLKPSTFRGVFKKIAGDINEALDKIAAKSGVERGPADLESVLGPLPAQPQMSAFSVPKSDGRAAPGSDPRGPGKPLPKAPPRRGMPQARAADSVDEPPASMDADFGDPPPISAGAPRNPGATAGIPRTPGGGSSSGASAGLPDAAAFGAALRGDSPAPTGSFPEEDDQPTRVASLKGALPAGPPAMTDDDDEVDDGLDEETQWRKVYADFISMKKKFGEPTDKLTYEKFRGTLQRNKDALMARHHCTKVKFRVYEKQGRAALKASPVK